VQLRGDAQCVMQRNMSVMAHFVIIGQVDGTPVIIGIFSPPFKPHDGSGACITEQIQLSLAVFGLTEANIGVNG